MTSRAGRRSIDAWRCPPATSLRTCATEELIVTKNSERQLRIIDHDQDGSMELKKREGYF